MLPQRSRVRRASPLRLYLFSGLFLLYLTPVLLSFPATFARDVPVAEPLPYAAQGWGIALWLGLLFGLYASLRSIGQWLPLKMHRKSPAAHKNDVTQLAYMGMALAVTAGLAARMTSVETDETIGLPFSHLTVFYTLFYTLLFEVLRPINMTLSSDMVGNVPALLTFAACMIVLLGIFAGHLRHALSQPPAFRNAYLAWIVVGAAFHAGILLRPSIAGVPGRAYLHLHHWYWPLPFAHMAIFRSELSMLSQAMFLGIFIHGAACFGCEPLFYDGELMARRPSLFELRLKAGAAMGPPAAEAGPPLADAEESDSSVDAVGEVLATLLGPPLDSGPANTL
eukprot:EG_transcript_13654